MARRKKKTNYIGGILTGVALGWGLSIVGRKIFATDYPSEPYVGFEGVQ